MAIRVGVNILQFCSVSNSLSHTQTFQIKWEVYFFKEVFARLYSLRQYVFCMHMCIYAYLLYEYTTDFFSENLQIQIPNIYKHHQNTGRNI